MKKTAVVIVNYNGGEDVLECLQSVSRLEVESEKLEIIVVDNGSKDRSVAMIKTQFSQVRVYENQENLGFAEGNNVGIKEALKGGADYVMLLNSDTLIDRDCLKELLKVTREDQKIDVLCPKIYFAAGFEFHKERYKKVERGRVIWYAGGKIDWQNILGIHRGVDKVDNGQYDKITKIEFATGCCLLVKREVFEKVGLLDKGYFLYLEDLDFSVRVKKAGFQLVFVPKAIVWHKNLGTTRQESATRQAYYYTRNRLLFGLKYASFATKTALLKWSLKKLVRGNFWEKRGVRDFYLGRFGKGSYE